MRLFLLQEMTGKIADAGDDHAVQRGDSPADQIGDHSAQHHADDSVPVDDPGDLCILVVFPIQEVAQHQNDAHGRQGAVENVQPAAEVPVQPHGGNDR